MTNSQIALRISGTKERKAGFAPLVISGVFPQAEEGGLDRPLTGCNGIGFVVKHMPTYSFYMAIDGKVRAFDTATPGVLTVAITIPAHQKLAGDKSPYTLLKELYNLFREEYMTKSADGRHVFQNVMADPEPFKAILNRYGLESTIRPRVSMNPAGPTGKLNVSTDKMPEFFKDSFYPEFRNFKDIEVGDGLATSTSLQNIAIPRPVICKVYVNGERKNEVNLNNLDDQIKAYKSPDDQSCYEDCSFTLRELLENNGSLDMDGSEIKLDSANERIDCTLKRRKIPYKVFIHSDNDPALRNKMCEWLSNGKLVIKLNKKNSSSSSFENISLAALKGTLSLTYDEINNSVIKVMPDRLDGYIIKAQDRIMRINTSTHQANIVINLEKDKTVAQKQSVNNRYGSQKSPEIISGIKSGDQLGLNKNRNQKGLNNQQRQVEWGNQSSSDEPEHKSGDSKDMKIPMLCTLLIGVLIGFAAGYYVDKYLFIHEPTAEQIEQIIKDHQQSLINVETGGSENGIDPNAVTEVGKDETHNSEDLTSNPEQKDTDKSKETDDAAKEAAANEAALKKQAIQLFNGGKKDKFRNLCIENKSLNKYAQKGYDILNTLQTAKSNYVFVALLQEADYLTSPDARGKKSEIKTSLDEIDAMYSEIQKIKSKL